MHRLLAMGIAAGVADQIFAPGFGEVAPNFHEGLAAFLARRAPAFGVE